jgi:hypothetical protein
VKRASSRKGAPAPAVCTALARRAWLRRALLRDFWDESLTQLKDAAEDQQRHKGKRRARK